jgi:hypothetical protein
MIRSRSPAVARASRLGTPAAHHQASEIGALHARVAGGHGMPDPGRRTARSVRPARERRLNRASASTVKWRWQTEPPARLDSGFGFAHARNPAWSPHMLGEQGTKICAVCPHANDCRKTGACLDDVNARYVTTHPNQFPQPALRPRPYPVPLGNPVCWDIAAPSARL